MKSRFLTTAAILLFLSILMLPCPGECDSYIHLNSGSAYQCGNEFWTDSQDIFSGWVWIAPGPGGVQGASFRIAGCPGSIIHLSIEFGPGITSVGDPAGNGVEIAVDPCRTEPFFVCRINWFNLNLDDCFSQPVETMTGDFSDVTCTGQTGALLAYDFIAFNTYECMCGGAPRPSRCHQIEPDRIRVVFRSPPVQIDCGEDFTHFRVVERLNFEYPDTLEVVEAEFDSFNCPYCNLCDSIVALFTFDAPLDQSKNYAFCLDGFGSECCGCGGKRYVSIERLIPVATLLEEFSAGFEDGNVVVRWSLSMRDDGAVFSIERARDGTDFAGLPDGPEDLGGEEYLFADEDIVPGSSYSYRILVEDGEGERILFETEPMDVPSVPLTLSNHPNPFNPSTEIEYSLPSPGRVSVSIYDVSGKLVRRLVDGNAESGVHSVVWNGLDERKSPQPSGIYFCRLRLGKIEVTSKLVLLR